MDKTTTRKISQPNTFEVVNANHFAAVHFKGINRGIHFRLINRNVLTCVVGFRDLCRFTFQVSQIRFNEVSCFDYLARSMWRNENQHKQDKFWKWQQQQLIHGKSWCRSIKTISFVCHLIELWRCLLILLPFCVYCPMQSS